MWLPELPYQDLLPLCSQTTTTTTVLKVSTFSTDLFFLIKRFAWFLFSPVSIFILVVKRGKRLVFIGLRGWEPFLQSPRLFYSHRHQGSRYIKLRETREKETRRCVNIYDGSGGSSPEGGLVHVFTRHCAAGVESRRPPGQEAQTSLALQSLWFVFVAGRRPLFDWTERLVRQALALALVLPWLRGHRVFLSWNTEASDGVFTAHGRDQESDRRSCRCVRVVQQQSPKGDAGVCVCVFPHTSRTVG